MSDITDPIAQLMALRQIYAARQRLEAIKISNPRIWGLDHRLTQINQLIAQAEQLIGQGDAALIAGQPRLAATRYVEASKLADDHPTLRGKMNSLAKRLAEAKDLFEQAADMYRHDEWDQAKSLIHRSLSLNPQSQSAQQLQASLTSLMRQESGERRQIRTILAIGGCVALAILIVGGISIWKILPDRSSNPAAADDNHAPVPPVPAIASATQPSNPAAIFPPTSQPSASSIPTISATAPSTTLPPASQPSTPLDPTTLFAKASPAVVRIFVRDRQFQPLGQGSGFFVSTDGLLVTNYHVIKGADIATVVLSNDVTLFVDGVTAVDAENDLAVLKVNSSNLPILSLSTDEPEVGVKVYAIGNPRGLTNTLSEGLVSAVRQLDNQEMIQTTAAISPGSSGGPLLNVNGQVIGVTSSARIDGQNLNFAHPASKIIQLLRNQGKVVTLASAGGKPLDKANATALDEVWALIGKKSWAEGLGRLSKLRPQMEDNPSYWFAAGYLHLSMGNLDLAIQANLTAIRLHPDFAEAFHNLGIAYFNQKKYGEAIAAYQAALASKPDQAITYRALGNAYLTEQKYIDAIATYKTSLQLESNNFEAQSSLGFAYIGSKNNIEAVKAFQAALTIQPKSPLALYGLGIAQREQGQIRAAIVTLRAAHGIDPKDPAISYELGVTLAKDHHDSEAIGCFRLAVANRPDNALYHFALANALASFRNIHEAIQQWEVVVQLDPDGALGRQATQNIAATSLPAERP